MDWVYMHFWFFLLNIKKISLKLLKKISLPTKNTKFMYYYND